tara:strand:- start:2516 stop:3550 length:1035 start_codon:yes stop_codon:yes gene_type:complete
MVKKPPCKEYEPPKNIMYKRGDKMFCRKKRNNNNFIYNQVNNNSGPEFVFTTKVDKKYIEGYGENHSKKLQQNNIYRDIIENIDIKDYLILVEHSTIFCDITPEQDKLFKEQIQYSGSEYIFYHMIKKKLKNIKCIDNRLEFGYFSKISEDVHIEMIKELIQEKPTLKNKNKIDIILVNFLVLLKKYMENKEYYLNKDIYTDVYRENILSITRQLRLCGLIKKLRIGELRKKECLKEHGLSNWDILTRTMYIITINFIKLGAITVDINIYNNIVETKNKKILIFAGRNHIIRLYSILDSPMSRTYITDDDNSEDYFKNANAFPDGNKEKEINCINYIIENYNFK